MLDHTVEIDPIHPVPEYEIRSECELVRHASPHPWPKQSWVRDNPPSADQHHQVCELLQRLAP